MIADLFNTPALPGLSFQADAISPTEEAALIARIDAEPLSPFRFQGWTGRRLTQSFGWSYDFETQRLTRATPIPDWLLPFRERLADFAGLDPQALIQALLIRYDVGAGIGWHRDRPIYEHVIGLSLGAPAKMRFRRRLPGQRFQRVTVPLASRDAYHLAGEARHEWEHSIAEMDRTRWSITFRSPSRLWDRRKNPA